MIVKFINCQVKPSLKPDFSQGQRCWHHTAESDGFIAQVGGWQNNRAIILALWDSKAAVDSFMQLSHDVIAKNADQQDSYNSLEVDYLQHVLDIPGLQADPFAVSQPVSPALNSLAMTSTVKAAKLIAHTQFIRIARYNVSAEKVNDFIEELDSLWIPAMAKVKGMLGGKLLRSNTKENQFLVLTCWLSEAHYQYYAKHIFNDIKVLAKHIPLTKGMQDYQIKVEPQWQFTQTVDTILRGS